MKPITWLIIAGLYAWAWVRIATAGVTTWPLGDTRFLAPSPVTATAILIIGTVAMLLIVIGGGRRPRT